MKYAGIIIDRNSWGERTGPAVISDCGHHHRTPDAAKRCIDREYGESHHPASLGVGQWQADGTIRRVPVWEPETV